MTRTKTKTISITKKQGWVYILSLLVVALVALYTYFLSASVVHVVMRQEIQQTVVQLQSHIGSLETDYIDAQHSLSTSVANLDGYTKAETKVFIDRTSETLVLSQPQSNF